MLAFILRGLENYLLCVAEAAMGFVKRNLELEAYLDSKEICWRWISDAEYRRIFAKIREFVDAPDESKSLYGDEAFMALRSKLPIDGYMFSAPGHKSLSISSDAQSPTFGYMLEKLEVLERERLNQIECIVADADCNFVYVFNHEWQALCPEVFIERKHNDAFKPTWPDGPA
jgi:hypothetical protein